MTAESDELDALAEALAGVGRQVRAAVRSVPRTAADAAVVRSEGGDEVFGVDARADQAVLAAIAELGYRWPGRLVMEGFADPLPVGDGDGPWTYLVDPVDGSRGFLAGKRPAWVLLGAGRHARTLEDHEVGAAVELPTDRAAVGMVAWARRGGPPHAEDDDLANPAATPTPVALNPRAGAELSRTFVTVVRFAPGAKGAIGAWEDELLAGLEVYEDQWLCTGGLMMGLATGADSAVLDPRPLLCGDQLAAHPYDLAALVIARAAGVVVEALPAGPLHVPLRPDEPVAWAGYANEEIAARLRPTGPITPPRATPARDRGGTG